MATDVIANDNVGACNDHESMKIVQLSNLEAFIKKTLGGAGEGLPIETLANTIVNKFYGSQLFSDSAMGKIQDEKWKVGMQVLVLSKSKDRWIRGFIRCLEAEGYITVAYGNRVKTLHPDSESIKPAANTPDKSRSITSKTWRTSDKAKLEVTRTSAQSFIPKEKVDEVKLVDQRESSDIQSMNEYRETQFREIMLVLEKELETNEMSIAPGSASVLTATSTPIIATRVRADSCPNQIRNKLLTSLKRIKVPVSIVDYDKLDNSITDSEQQQRPSENRLSKNFHPNITVISEVKSFIEVASDKDIVNSNEAKSRKSKKSARQELEYALDTTEEVNEDRRFATMSQQDYVAKVLVIGDVCAGKTSIIHKYVKKNFNAERRATVGIDFASKRVRMGSEVLQIIFWDIAGQERFIGLAPTFYRNADAVLIVLDATSNMGNLDNTARWKSEVDGKVFYPNGDPLAVVLFANKWDLIEAGEKLQVFSEALLDDFCRKQNFNGWFPTSAKTGLNISEGMKFLIHKIQENRYKQEDSSDIQSKPSEGVINLNPCNPNSIKGTRCCGI